MQTITVNPKISITIPPDQVLIDRTEYDRLVQAADFNSWWDKDDLLARYHRNKDWFRDHVFVPFEKQLRNTCVMYPRGGRSSYLCDPVGFGRWMRINFEQIAKEAER